MSARFVLGWVTILAAGCAGDAAVRGGPGAAPREPSSLHVFAEGPCPKLSIEAAGERRFLVYGDHGRALGGWLPGDRVPAAESLAELRGGRAYRRPSLLRGLPSDARGYVPGELRLGGSAKEPWLVRTTSRYSLLRRGPLFERFPIGYTFEGGWRETEAPVTFPDSARELPELPERELCGPELGFVPLTWTATPAGGLVVAGRCDDEKPANYPVTTLMAAHGAPHAKSWQVKLLPAGETLSGIVNLAIHAVSDSELYLSAYEPFEEPEKRKAYLTRFDGKDWQNVELPVHDGLMSITSDGRGTHPWNKLPLSGRYYYSAPEKAGAPVRGHQNGLVDERGNEWVWHPANNVAGICEHWDVQHPSGDHSRIDPGGSNHHGTPYDEFFP